MKNIIKALVLIAAMCTTASSFATTEAEKVEFERQRSLFGIKTLLATESNAMDNLLDKITETIKQAPTKIESEAEKWKFAKKIFISDVDYSLKPIMRWNRNFALSVGGLCVAFGLTTGTLLYKFSKPGGDIRKIIIPTSAISSFIGLGGSIYGYTTIHSTAKKRLQALALEFIIYLSENVTVAWENCKNILPKQIILHIEKARDSKEKLDLSLIAEYIIKEIKR
jgi:hypothetical protein